MKTDIAEAPSHTDEAENLLPAVTQTDRDEITHETLTIVVGIVAAIYLLFSVSHVFFVPAPHNTTLASIAFASFLIFSLVTALSYRSLLPQRVANTVQFSAALIVLSNVALHIYLTDDLLQTTNLALILMAWGLFVLSVRWFILFICCTALVWLGLQQAMTYNPQLASHYTFMLLSAVGISTITFVARYASFNRVIAYRKKDAEVQETLRQALARVSEADFAEERNDAKDTFIAHLSHELRTPLNAIVGFSEAIKLKTMGPIGNPKYAEYIEDINGAGLHLTSILEDLHDLVLVEKGELKVTLATFSAPQILDSCLSLVTHRAQGKNISLQVTCDPELTFLSSDKHRFRQIFVNLLTNAIKYTPQGGDVTLQGGIHSDGRLLFEVIDSGVGMTPDEVTKAKSPFWRAGPDMSVGDVEGSGLGLAITTQLTELLGGTFELSSEKGKGTTARIWLPQSCRAFDQPSATSFAQDRRA